MSNPAPPIRDPSQAPADRDEIHALVAAAFGRKMEADLVDKLRCGEGFLPQLSLIAEQNEVILGHVMITRLEIRTDLGTNIATTILAPLAVLPSHQNRGTGSALTRHVLDLASDQGHKSMILIGHANYYPRFGFQPASTWGIRYARPIRDEVFMAIELVHGALANAAGVLTLPSEFDET